MKFPHKFGVGSSLKTYPRIFLSTPKNSAGKTSNFGQLPPTGRQSEARNFETAEHIDKQKPVISSTINAPKTIPNLGASPYGVLMQPMEKIDKL